VSGTSAGNTLILVVVSTLVVAVVASFFAVEEGSFTTIADSPGFELGKAAAFTSGVLGAAFWVAKLLANVHGSLTVVPPVVTNKCVPLAILVEVDSSAWVRLKTNGS
jgi:hypothetical protein